MNLSLKLNQVSVEYRSNMDGLTTFWMNYSFVLPALLLTASLLGCICLSCLGWSWLSWLVLFLFLFFIICHIILVHKRSVVCFGRSSLRIWINALLLKLCSSLLFTHDFSITGSSGRCCRATLFISIIGSSSAFLGFGPVDISLITSCHFKLF